MKGSSTIAMCGIPHSCNSKVVSLLSCVWRVIFLNIFFIVRFTSYFVLKEQSRPWVSKVKSADVRLATGIGRGTSLVNIMKLV